MKNAKSAGNKISLYSQKLFLVHDWFLTNIFHSQILCRECGFFCLGGCEEFYCQGFSCLREGQLKPEISSCSECQGVVCGYCAEQIECGRCGDCCQHCISNPSSEFLKREACLLQLRIGQRKASADPTVRRTLERLQVCSHPWRSWNHSISDHPDGWLFRTRIDCEG